MVDAAIAGAGILVSVIKAVTKALRNIEEIEKMHLRLCKRVVEINYAIESFQSGEPVKEEVFGHLMSGEKWDKLKSILEKVVETLNGAREAEGKLTKKLRRKLRLWDRTEHL